jgi:hypothetical protein
MLLLLVYQVVQGHSASPLSPKIHPYPSIGNLLTFRNAGCFGRWRSSFVRLGQSRVRSTGVCPLCLGGMEDDGGEAGS